MKKIFTFFVGIFIISNLFASNIIISDFESVNPTITTAYGSTIESVENPTI